MKVKHPLVVTVMTISLAMIMTKTGMEIEKHNQISVNCAVQVSAENWEIKSHILTSGNIEDDTIEKICSIIQEQVPDEAWNYLCNSGGKLVVVEGNDVKDYVFANYNCSTKDKTEEEVRKALEGKTIKGYCPYFKDKFGVLEKTDVIIAEDCLDSLLHEFCHVLDYSHDYSKSEEFKEIYKRADEIVDKLSMDKDDKKYYSSSETEFFAEMSARYIENSLQGVDTELENYLADILK